MTTPEFGAEAQGSTATSIPREAGGISDVRNSAYSKSGQLDYANAVSSKANTADLAEFGLFDGNATSEHSLATALKPGNTTECSRDDSQTPGQEAGAKIWNQYENLSLSTLPRTTDSDVNAPVVHDNAVLPPSASAIDGSQNINAPLEGGNGNVSDHGSIASPSADGSAVWNAYENLSAQTRPVDPFDNVNAPDSNLNTMTADGVPETGAGNHINTPEHK